jgi:hypothetical protein
MGSDRRCASIPPQYFAQTIIPIPAQNRCHVQEKKGKGNSSYTEPLAQACKDYRYIIELERYIRLSDGFPSRYT